MHADNIDWADDMERWKNDPANRKLSKPGDDRTPPWRWIGCLNWTHPTTGVVSVPAEYIMASMMGGAAQVSTGKRQGTFKAQSQSGLMMTDFQLTLLNKSEPVQMADVVECKKMKTFKDNAEAVEALGFELFVKRARIGAAKHIRVRPRFDNWSVMGQITVTDPQITMTVLRNILEIAGTVKGLGDWRPGASKPGPFGRYEVKLST